MTDSQLYILVAIPLVGILANTGLFVHLSTRIEHLSDRMEGKFERIEAKFEVLTGKVVDIDNRLMRLEAR
jgi:hypothetical protein